MPLTKSEVEFWLYNYNKARKWNQQKCGVYYHYELLNIDGIIAWFFLTPDITIDNLNQAISKLKTDDDVVKVKVIKFDFIPE